MSRARSNFITNRNSLPKEILSITENKKFKEDELSQLESNSSNTNKTKDPLNVLFFKKPKFLGNKKEFSNKMNLEGQVNKINI